MSVLPQSLARRLLLAALLLLPLTLGSTAWYLERAHREALDAAIAERLQLQVLALLAQAEISDGLELPLRPMETRLLQPGSGLYALVSGALGEPLWMSPSAALLPSPLERLTGAIPTLGPGERHDSERDGLMRHAYQVVWEMESGESLPLQFLVAESAAPRDADVVAFREQLLLWLAATLLLLLLIQVLIARWGLQPLRQLAERIARIESGEGIDLAGEWPTEVRPLVDNLEALLAGEQQRRDRMRNTLSDLAHSLKTPLAVLRSSDPASSSFAELQREQLERMEEVIGWHLQRAVGGNHRLLQRTDVMPVVERLRNTLLKVYAARQLTVTLSGESSAQFRGDERDLMELLGNLLDNACKYAAKLVHVEVSGGAEEARLRLCIDDDGDGISPELRDTLLDRGARADTRREGQGIGLAVVRDIVESQGGTIRLGESPLGGARVEIAMS
ncbi:MAG: ATP-binding protein [Congregibacter sp.]